MKVGRVATRPPHSTHTEYDSLVQARLQEGLRTIRPDALFVGEEGSGQAFRPEGACWIVDLIDGIVIFGTSPYDASLSERSFQLAYNYFRQSADVRRSGSAALDLCAVAAGRAELFFELQLSPWDHAAGGLIVQEAGGTVSDANGKPLGYAGTSSVVARGSGIPAGGL